MNSVWTTILAYCLAALAFRNYEVLATRCMEDKPVTIDKVPYMVQLRRQDGTFSCAGTLVSPHFVLTAADCVYGEEFNHLVAVGGVTSLNKDGVTREVSNITLHTEYDQHKTRFALLKLKGEMKGDNIEPVPLCKQPLKEGDSIQVTGWGPLTNFAIWRLRTYNFTVKSKKTCARESPRDFVAKNMICSSGYKDIGTCFGDLGGPAIYKGQLCGINAATWPNDVGTSSIGFGDVHALSSYLAKLMNEEEKGFSLSSRYESYMKERNQ